MRAWLNRRSCLVRQFITTAGVPAIARQLRGIAGIVAVLAAILGILWSQAVTGRMTAFLGYSHSCLRAPFVVKHRTAVGWNCFLPSQRPNPGPKPRQWAWFQAVN